VSVLIRVVANCTDRKRFTAAPDLLLRSYPEDLTTRATRWTERITNPTGAGVRADELYQGEHWGVVAQLDGIARAQRLEVELWVASAGYGLLRADDLVEPYGATFALGSEDSVTREPGHGGAVSNAEFWWRRVNERPRPRQSPDSIASLAGQQPASPLLVILSESYTRAVGPDLLEAAECLDDPANLLLVSAGSSGGTLGRLRVPASARFQHALGGTRLSLNARIAKRIVETTADHGWDGRIIRSRLATELAGLPDNIRHDRRPLTDHEVISFIHTELASAPGSSRSALLRRLRDQNQACEQKRFSRLFNVATQGSP
jgi:hypothetical protein